MSINVPSDSGIIIPENSLLRYVDKLQRENADDLAFYPLTTLEKAIESGHVLFVEENDEAAGYLWFGALRGGYDVIIYQACIDYTARRRHLGFSLVADLIRLAKAAGANGIRLKCASSADSNEFWRALGFQCINVIPGGRKRGRDLNVYRNEIVSGLFQFPEVEPSDKPIDLKAYNAAKRAGEAMPSRFSRSHYGFETAGGAE